MAAGLGVSINYLAGLTDTPAPNSEELKWYAKVLFDSSHPPNEDIPQYVVIPILGEVAAGAPALAEQNYEGYVHIPWPKVSCCRDVVPVKH